MIVRFASCTAFRHVADLVLALSKTWWMETVISSTAAAMLEAALLC